MRRAARVDDNQPEIINAFRAMGATVQPLHMVGKGCPDIIVGMHGLNILVEIKDGSKPPSARQLTDDERDWHSKWRGNVEVVETLEDVAELVLEIKKGERGRL